MLFVLNGFAHDPDRAFFTISVTEENTIVEAELPWTIRNALFKFQASLQKAKTKSEFDSAFFQYVSQNFVLIQKNGENLQLKEVNPVKKENGHSHQNNYEFIFEGNEFTTVKNTILCEHNKSQINYHELLLAEKTKEFTTSKESPKFKIGKLKDHHIPFVTIGIAIGSILVIGTIVFILLKYKKRLKS